MKAFVLFGIDAHHGAHLVCAIICKEIADVHAAIGGKLTGIGSSRDHASYRMHFPGHQICGVFVPDADTPMRIARIEHPDAPQDALAALADSHRWAGTNCFREYLLGSVPTATVDGRGRRA